MSQGQNDIVEQLAKMKGYEYLYVIDPAFKKFVDAKVKQAIMDKVWNLKPKWIPRRLWTILWRKLI